MSLPSSSSVRRRCTIVFVVVVSMIGSSGATAEQQAREPVLAASEDTAELTKIRTKLANPVTLEFVETPLSDVIDFLRDFTGVNIVLDKPAIDEEGVNSDTPISVHLQSIRLSSALSVLLEQFNLTWLLQDECVLLTSRVVAARRMVTWSYPVGDLVPAADDGEKLVLLAKRVLCSGRGEFPGERIPFLDSLKAIVLTDNLPSHAQIARLLEQLRGGLEEPESVKKIHAKLNDPVTLEFVETPLSDVIDFLRDLAGVNIVLDRLALEGEGINSNTPVTIHVQSVSMQSALKILLGQFNLMSKIENECLLITSKPSDQERFSLRAYPLRKLLSERAQPRRDEWLALAQSVIGPDSGATDAADVRRVFPPGTKVRVRWGGSEFGGTVSDLTENTYRVQFRLGESERNEWVDASQVNESVRKAPTPRPVIDFYEPRQSLVVLGPDSLQKDVENLISLVVKTAERSAK
jgi:hypothetical protein